VQFHPEFDAGVIRTYLEERREIIRSEGGDPDALLRKARESPDGAALLRRFATQLRRWPRLGDRHPKTALGSPRILLLIPDSDLAGDAPWPSFRASFRANPGAAAGRVVPKASSVAS
jgi:hypothetical protein